MTSSTIGKNIVANYVGRLIQLVLNFIAVPIYVHFLGMEAYGLIGFFASMQGVLALLDLGLGVTINRELARNDLSKVSGIAKARDALRTLEWLYWIVGVIIGVGVALAAPALATKWLSARELPIRTLTLAVAMQGLVLAFRWPMGLYTGGFLGLQRQVRLNAIQSGFGIFQHGGAILLVTLIAADIRLYIAWQGVIAATQTGFMAIALWRAMPDGRRPRLNLESLREVWRFAAGNTAINLTSVVLTQSDKILLSRMLPLNEFGYYSLAWSVASIMGQLSGPITQSYFPVFSQSWERGDMKSLSLHYHRGAQRVAFVVIPLALAVSFFAGPLLQLYVHDSIVVTHTHKLLSFMVVGFALNSVMVVPYYLTLAAGWTRLNVLVNCVTILVQIPLLILLVPAIGALGAAIVWILLNAGYVAFQIPLMHRRLLPTEMGAWYWRDNFPVLALSLLCSALLGAAVSTFQLGAIVGSVAAATSWFGSALLIYCLVPWGNSVVPIRALVRRITRQSEL